MRGAKTAITPWVLTAALAAPAFTVGQTPYRSGEPTFDGLPPIGSRYQSLSPAERAALRPTMRLPLRALFEVDSAAQLTAAVVVDPLPDPDRPLLPTATAPGGGDPFADDGAGFDGGALGALGELFAREAELLRAAGKTPPAALPPAADEPYQPEPDETPADEPAAEDDPFADSDDFAEDPFGF